MEALSTYKHQKILSSVEYSKTNKWEKAHNGGTYDYHQYCKHYILSH